MKKKTLALLSAIILIFSLLPITAFAAQSENFTDVSKSHWANSYINEVVSRGYFLGSGDKTFSPDDSMSRGMFITVLSRIAGVTVDNSKGTAFSDVPAGQYYTGAVAWGAKNGLMKGKSSTEFHANDPITREDMALAIVELAKSLNITLPQSKEWIEFKDQDQISANALDAVKVAVRAGIINGYGDGRLNPKGSSTRAEVAAVMTRFCLIPASAKTLAADGVTGIADKSYDYLFGGDAAQGIAKLVAAGAVTINDVPVPTVTGKDTYSADKLDINGGRGLWKNADGTWSWDVHVLFKGENKSYADAVVGFVNHVTMLRGINYDLTIANGTVTKLEATIFDVALANTVTKGADYTTITTVEKGDNSTGKPNPGTISFPNANVEGNPQSQDIVLYWEDAEGWHLKRAASAAVTVDVNIAVTDGKEKISGTIGGKAILDSRLTLQYSEPWNRPSQPVRAMAWMGEDNVSVIQWTCAPGITVGISRGDGAKAALQSAISKAETALGTVVVSAAGDGSDVPTSKMWVSKEYNTIFTKAIADAKAALNKAGSTNAEYEGALYRLAQAYGGRTGDRFSWLENTYFGKGDDYGRAAAYDTGYNGTGFWTFAQSHFGAKGN